MFLFIKILWHFASAFEMAKNLEKLIIIIYVKNVSEWEYFTNEIYKLQVSLISFYCYIHKKSISCICIAWCFFISFDQQLFNLLICPINKNVPSILSSPNFFLIRHLYFIFSPFGCEWVLTFNSQCLNFNFFIFIFVPIREEIY
jgi:hypothetical protein